MLERSPGLLLQSISYLGSHRILKVLTPEHGLISLLAKFAASRKRSWSALTTPFLLAEWVYVRGKSDLSVLKDGSLVEPFLELKTSYGRLSTAGQMAQDLLRTQMPEKRAEGPFSLAVESFQELGAGKNPADVLVHFRKALLDWEGLWNEGNDLKRVHELFEQRLGQV